MKKLFVLMLLLSSCTKEVMIPINGEAPPNYVKIDFDSTITDSSYVFFQYNYHTEGLQLDSYHYANINDIIRSFVSYRASIIDKYIERTSINDTSIIIHSFAKHYYTNKKVKVYAR